LVEFGDRELPQRFWSKVNPNGPLWNGTPCWEWTASKDKDGYGHFAVGRRMALAHRIAYEAFTGPIPDGLESDHLCRNPSCVNPLHLEPVTSKVNSQRGLTGLAAGAVMKAKTHCPHGHPYDEVNTYFRKNGDRLCKTCSNLRGKAAWRAKHGGASSGI